MRKVCSEREKNQRVFVNAATSLLLSCCRHDERVKGNAERFGARVSASSFFNGSLPAIKPRPSFLFSLLCSDHHQAPVLFSVSLSFMISSQQLDHPLVFLLRALVREGEQEEESRRKK